MKLVAILASMACATVCSAYDVSHLLDGTYKVLVSWNGSIDWNTATLANGTYKPLDLPLLMRYPLSRIRPTTINYEHNNEDDDESESPGSGSGGVIDNNPDHQQVGGGHCHNHFPHHGNLFLPGQIEFNRQSYPAALALFMDWMSQGVEGGWINPGEVRFSKYHDLIIGACVFKLHRKRTCVHELSLAMNGADSECAAGRMGCHVCMGHWGKDYFRFDVREAPTQCRCAWHY